MLQDTAKQTIMIKLGFLKDHRLRLHEQIKNGPTQPDKTQQTIWVAAGDKMAILQAVLKWTGEGKKSRSSSKMISYTFFLLEVL